MISLLIYGFLFQLAFNEVSTNSPDDKLDNNGYRCNEYGVCLPGAEDIAVPPRTIQADNTCGSPPYNNYCLLQQQRTCFECNSTSNENKHPADKMIDRNGDGYSTSNFETWWQSQNWWEWLQAGGQQPLPVNITIRLNKSYVVTGDVRVTFKFTKPAQMVMEKSKDFRQTWTPLQYFADNCLTRFGMEPSSLNCSNDAVLCSEKYSDQNEGPLYFSFLNCYTRQTFWDPKIQNLLEATDLRLRLLYPATDGLHGLGSEINLRKYFYAISDIQVFGRCQCHGHGENCEFPEDVNSKSGYLNEPECICKHNTKGINCEMCQPLYNNKTWMPATSMSQSNPCEKCECHLHSSSCTYNNTLGHGICDNCDHNTRGYFCEQCKDKFYRNLSRTLNDPSVCLDCNCAQEGITNNGSCSQEVANIGQCECKQNVTGRRCDKCEDAYYGYTNHPVGNCIACECNEHGTINGSLNCHNVTGECSCKDNIDQRTCSQCKLGFHSFPNTTDGDCLPCDYCDPGGTTPDICEKIQGICLCRYGIQNANCSNVTSERFFPKYDYFLYEAEYQSGNYNLTSNISEYNTFFTGRGYAEIVNQQYIEFEIYVQVKNNFTVTLRYSINTIGEFEVSIRGNMTSECPEINQNISMDGLQPDARGASWEANERILLCPDIKYTIRVYSKDRNTSIKVDSLLLIPDLTQLKSYKHYAELNYSSISPSGCQSNFTTIQKSNQAPPGCRAVTFSTMVELLNGSLACNCSLIGAMSRECEDYGGQCQCKQGIMGRTCDRCEPGYYNFTENGCTPCNCDGLGSENFVCEPVTGNCLCKRGVEGRACDHCEQHHYGIHTRQGCTPCNCDPTGSLNLTCHDVTGKCYCKPGVEDVSTDKCNICRENYFNFTEQGCMACNCNEAGSRSLQCHNRSGECACKDNTNGMKCSQCIDGTFSLEKTNPSGCIPCFCFNRTEQCSTANGYSLSEIKQSNLTILTQGYTRLSRIFQGYQLYSYVRGFEVQLTVTVNMTDLKLYLKGLNYTATLRLTNTHCHTQALDRYCVILHEKYSQERLTANQMQSVLADLNEVALNISGDLGNGTAINVTMGTAIRNRHGNQASHVERCECPGHYKELSCQNCNTGFTREIANSNAFVNCTLCSCNNRSTTKTCDGESGVCENCRLSLGDHCEICGFGVDHTTGCQQCSPEYWHPDIENEEKQCRACNCVLANTLYHNSSVCNDTTGQCLCKEYVGGSRCQHCKENYYNTSSGCRECPECYGLLTVHVHNLRDLIKEVTQTVKNLTKRFDSITNKEFDQRLTNATNKVNNIFDKAKVTANQDPNNLTMTIDVLDNLTSSVKKLEEHVERLTRQENELQGLLNKTSNWTEFAYASLQQANASRPKIVDLRNTIESFVQPLEVARESMKILNNTLWNIAENLTTISKSELNKMSQVLLNATTVKKNLENNTKNINLLQNETETSLKYGQETLNTSRNFSSQTNDVFDMSKEIMKTVNHLTKVIKANRNLTRNLNDSIFSPTFQYESSIHNASKSVKESQTQTTRATHVLNNTEILLNKAKAINQNATDANNSAINTLNDAHTTLETLENFQNISANATKTAGKSLELINNIKEESNRSIKEIMNVSKSVREGLSYTDEANRLADEAHALAQTENQGISSVYNRSKILDDHRKSTVCSRDLMIAYGKNITSRLSSSNATCPEARRTNERAHSSFNESRQTQANSLETQQDVKNVHEEVLKTQRKVENIENSIAANTHQTRVDTHSQLFQGLRADLVRLRQAKEKKALLIQQFKERVRTMKLEIKDLESLRDSFKDIPACSKT